MPLDGTGSFVERDRALAQAVKLALSRRKDAFSLWRDLDPHVFNIGTWATCAIGWLARAQHGSWRMHGAAPNREGPRWDNIFEAAADYFGITRTQAERLFSGNITIYGVEHQYEVTGTMVANAMKWMPVVIGEYLLREANGFAEIIEPYIEHEQPVIDINEDCESPSATRVIAHFRQMMSRIFGSATVVHRVSEAELVD